MSLESALRAGVKEASREKESPASFIPDWGANPCEPSKREPVNAAPYVNRTLTVSADVTLPVVCYGSCSACVPPTYDVTFKVDMNNVTDAFTTPCVNGTFNGWCGSCNPMTDANADGIW